MLSWLRTQSWFPVTVELIDELADSVYEKPQQVFAQGWSKRQYEDQPLFFNTAEKRTGWAFIGCGMDPEEGVRR